MSRSMSGAYHNKRQRKKLHLGEFRELGFDVSADLAAPLSQVARDEFIDLFLEQAIEGHGLLFGGGLNENFSGYVVSEKDRASATEEDRAALLAWLSKQNVLVNVKIGALRDAWYD